MRIAQVSPLYESVPPKFYGGTERIVHYLTEELVKQGHQVTLFASGDSRTSAELVPGWERALRLGNVADPLAHHLLMVEKVFQRSGEFDVIHSHVDYLPYPLIRRYPDVPVVTTLHGRLDLPELEPMYREFREIPVISISDSQREPISWANWQGTVHNGLPPDLYDFHPKPGGYLAFLGRISPEKRPDLAISIAIRSGLPLKMAAKVGRPDEDYFHDHIKPLLAHPLIEFVGEIGEGGKAGFLGNAVALLFPVDWPEPFGLAMIEAMACGTPVIALRKGAVPEVVRDGVSGFVVRDEDEAVAAVAAAAALDRAACRAYFEERFTDKRMAEDYLRIYLSLAQAYGRADGGTHNGGGYVLHHGRLLAGGEAEQGAEARRDLRRL
ncbi:MAG TPA: glycosyltransferase family 4 protein [Fibrobacteria bacterium]|nr:glycosyltransferase family 4 protein [Fibrobacteria bacterium]